VFPEIVPYLVFLHVLGAILAFGPTFAYSVMGSMAAKEPQHANFSTRQVEAIGNRLVYPLAVFQGITGVLIILAAGYGVMSRAWLVVAIVLYLFTLTYALTVQRNAVHHLIELTSSPPPPGATGPSPEIVATVKRIQRGGILLAAMIVIIVFLMVVKPGA
jgi:uncharacterized membrane protein